MSVTHWIVWENADPEDPDLVSLECRCGRRYVGRRAYDDLAAHLAWKNDGQI